MKGVNNIMEIHSICSRTSLAVDVSLDICILHLKPMLRAL